MIQRQHIHKVVLRLADSWSNWNLKMLVFKERGKPEYPENNLSEQRREPTTNSTHIWHLHLDLNPSHIGGRRALSSLRHPLLPKIDNELVISQPPVYFKSVKIMKICFTKKKNKTKQNKIKNDQRKGKKSSSGSRTPNLRRVRSRRYSFAQRQLILNKTVQFIIFNIFAHKILSVDAV